MRPVVIGHLIDGLRASYRANPTRRNDNPAAIRRRDTMAGDGRDCGPIVVECQLFAGPDVAYLTRHQLDYAPLGQRDVLGTWAFRSTSFDE